MRSKAAASLSSPVPRRTARSMFSFGMLAARARSTARRRPKFDSGSPPPSRAARAISRARRVKMLPRLASLAAFLRLMVDHLECPDMLLAAPPEAGDEGTEIAQGNYTIREAFLIVKERFMALPPLAPCTASGAPPVAPCRGRRA